MQNKIKYRSLVFAAVIFILTFSYFSILHIKNKSSLPFKLGTLDSILIVQESNLSKSAISIGDTIVSIEGIPFTEDEEVEVFLDGLSENSIIRIDYLKNKSISSVNIKLAKFYSSFYVITACVTGVLLIFIGLFVLWKKHDSKSARIFNWVTLSSACIVLMTWGKYSVPLTFTDYIIHIIFSLCYSLAPVLFIHFTLTFPRKKNIPHLVLKLLYFSLFIMVLFSATYFIRAISIRSINAIQEFLVIFNASRIYSFAAILSGVIIFIHTYITSNSRLEKKKIRWVLLGIVLGPLVFAVLWVIPLAIINHGLVPEEIVVMFMLFVPITFAVAIVKHHIFDIDLLIKRSVIYFLSLGLLILIYSSIIVVLTHLANGFNEYLSSGVAAVIIALLFHPAKERIHKFVDKKFFRVKYDFRIASRNFLDEIKNSNDVKTLAEKIIQDIKFLIPINKQGFFLFSKSNNRVYLEAGQNFDLLMSRSILLDQKKIKTNLSEPLALSDKVEPGSRIEIADEAVFKRWGIVIVFPIKSNSDQLLGFLVLGEKKSGQRFTIEDIDLLTEVCLEAGMTIERIQIQQELIKEHLLKDKLQELNDLKSFFLSSVSHELKTPLTSIRMFSEFLKINENMEKEKKEEYLEIIEGECDRLGRLIENVLDLSKIERGVMGYRFRHIDIKALLNSALALMSYQIKMENCKVMTKICTEECEINGDADLIKSAVINLLSNAIKYSSIPKKIFIELQTDSESVNINFENSGYCLNSNELLKLSDPYYRAENVKKEKIPGSGIGLTLVNQIMDAHKGKLLINNIPDMGCQFTLSFPREKIDEKSFSD